MQVGFSTNEMKLDIWYYKLKMRVALRDAKRLKTYHLTKLGNIKKISNLSGDIKDISRIKALN